MKRRAALEWHLTNNIYPPLPPVLVGVAQRAIDRANAGEWDAPIRLPQGCTVNGKRRMEAQEIIEWMRLDSFIEGGEG